MRQAFSLIELSIVLVILGLLTGGILAGKSLIHAAELRKITSEASRYSSAFLAFRDKYFYLPGDLTNAINFWGHTTNAAEVCTTQTGTSSATGTCNGNGDGQMGNAGVNEERGWAWQHLALSGMIEGNYDGTGNLANQVLGQNFPISAIANAGYLVDTSTTTGVHSLRFGGMSGPTNQVKGPAVTPEDAWNIDTKRDDGNAATGKTLGFNSQDMAGATISPNCINSTTLTYDLTVTSITCRMFLGMF